MKTILITAALTCAVLSPTFADAKPCVYPTTAYLQAGMYGTNRTEAAAVKTASNQMVDQADSGFVNNRWRMPITVYAYVRATTWEHQFAAQLAARPVNIGLGRQYPINPFTLIEFKDSLGVVAWMPAGPDYVLHFTCIP